MINRKVFVLVAGVIVILAGCAVRLTSRSELTIVDGKQLVTMKKEGLSITYYGDYVFHDFTKKRTLNWSSTFSNSIAVLSNAKTLYCAHTTIAPYCSTIGVLYKNVKLSDCIKKMTLWYKVQNAINLNNTEESIGLNRFKILSFELTDPVLNVQRNYIEYYSEQGSNVMRISFWSTDSDATWLPRESSGIVGTLK
jgi:hypothetical protein